MNNVFNNNQPKFNTPEWWTKKRKTIIWRKVTVETKTLLNDDGSPILNDDNSNILTDD